MTISSRNWESSGNLRPPPPDSISIAGEVQLPTPGYQVKLERDPAKIFVPGDYRVRLIVEKLDGIWAQVITWFSVEYSAQDMNDTFTDAVILENGNEIGRVKIKKLY